VALLGSWRQLLEWQRSRAPREDCLDQRSTQPLAITTVNLSVIIGAGEKSRTPDLRITNALLYQLSYAGVAPGRLTGRGELSILAERPHFIAKAGSFGGTATFFSVA
jgi:hypothetical protein